MRHLRTTEEAPRQQRMVVREVGARKDLTRMQLCMGHMGRAAEQVDMVQMHMELEAHSSTNLALSCAMNIM